MTEKYEFKCHICSKEFNSGEELAEHILKEHPACKTSLL
ncbi:MAG TPA: hypothetical protein ENI78_01360 [Euryarchaeota archaeon]|nr:hypothetical protein [Euryarchaeota archaeon]